MLQYSIIETAVLHRSHAGFTYDTDAKVISHCVYTCMCIIN
jgi:hypothetical protein